MTNRLEKLKALLEGNPTDQLTRYMLAMEHDKAGETDECLDLFNGLMDETPAYIPAFVMCGQLFARLGRNDDARATFQRGIPAAQQQNDDHAAGEMSQFLAELP